MIHRFSYGDQGKRHEILLPLRIVCCKLIPLNYLDMFELNVERVTV